MAVLIDLDQTETAFFVYEIAFFLNLIFYFHAFLQSLVTLSDGAHYSGTVHIHYLPPFFVRFALLEFVQDSVYLYSHAMVHEFLSC